MTELQRLHRERDPRVRRRLARLLGAATLVGVLALAAVGLRVQQVHLAYRQDAMRAERARVEAAVRALEIEVATLRAPARIETHARRIGLVPPSAEQVRLAREFTPSGRGLAAGVVARAGEGGGALRNETPR